MFVNGFITSNNPFLDTEFLPLIESEESYKSNLLRQPFYWEYRNKNIKYKYNSNGHRSCEIDQLNYDYILFSGCSITEGVGLQEEDCYTHLVAKKLNKQFYNLGVGGSSPSIAIRNIITFLTKLKNNLPYAIVIQWPHFYRYYSIHGFHHKHFTPADKTEPLYKALLMDNDVFRYNMMERSYLLHFLSILDYKGKLCEIYSENQHDWELLVAHDHYCGFTNTFQKTIPGNVDVARDLSHPGSKTNKLYAESILDFF
jgi:hypothetical protein